MTNSAHRTSCHFLPIERISEPYHERRRHNRELWRTSRANFSISSSCSPNYHFGQPFLLDQSNGSPKLQQFGIYLHQLYACSGEKTLGNFSAGCHKRNRIKCSYNVKKNSLTLFNSL
ncbi:Os12g0133201 [Oryza sativa Japonica Group]|uniref:Os12g0133201 protein n=1 Tax=Oryza sativa subsp. japonica TaxID=39947 RepID=A0A0P0Y6M2_ORYSJ|nr:hypothetical protein EE612_057611 [Oryza sativa]BAT15768.1 Os12g0133201 [Oryza sativa Japonica Group]